MDYRSPGGYDRTRNAVIGNKNINLKYLEEAYTTEHWLVRVYRSVANCMCLEIHVVPLLRLSKKWQRNGRRF